MQTAHLPAASPELDPGGHAWQDSLMLLSRYIPGLHGLQKFEPSADT
jgi:hypothetical protein